MRQMKPLEASSLTTSQTGTLSRNFSWSGPLPLTASDSTPKVVLIAVFGISLLANFAGKSTVAA